MGYSGYVKGAAISGLIAAWSLAHCWRGLFVYFSNDDIMNMYWARETPPARLLLSVLVPFTSVYRPSGAVFYRCLYALFGMQALPFRVVFYLLLAVNIVLLSKITGPSVGALAAFLASFHNRYSDLYLNDGTIYDVLCGCCYFGALYYFIGMRSSERCWSWRQYLVLSLLATAALNAKEIAATLPAILALYEVLWHRGAWKKGPIGLVTLVMVAGTWARFRTGSKLMNNSAYAIHLDLGLANVAGYLNDLFCLHYGAVGTLTAVLIVASLFAMAALERSRALLFWAVFIVMSPLPVMFIPHRGLYAFYLPVMGWAAFAGILFARQPLVAILLAALMFATDQPIGWKEAMPGNSKLCELHEIYWQAFRHFRRGAVWCCWTIRCRRPGPP